MKMPFLADVSNSHARDHTTLPLHPALTKRHHDQVVAAL
jgi:hypothetical protein